MKRYNYAELRCVINEMEMTCINSINPLPGLTVWPSGDDEGDEGVNGAPPDHLVSQGGPVSGDVTQSPNHLLAYAQVVWSETGINRLQQLNHSPTDKAVGNKRLQI